MGNGYVLEKKSLRSFILLKRNYKLFPYLQPKQQEDQSASFPYPLICRREGWGIQVVAKKQVFTKKYH